MTSDHAAGRGRAFGPERAPLYHLAVESEWAAAAAAGEYRRSTLGRSLDEVGFIHTSFAEQVQATADAFYAGRTDIVLVHIDPARLAVEVRVEEVAGGERFPHVYGPLPVDAVTRVDAVPTDNTGRLLVGPLLGSTPSEPGHDG